MSSPDPTTLVTPGGTFPLETYRLEAAGRAWTFLHAGVVLSRDDENDYLKETSKHVPYGFALWPSSIALAHELIARASELRGQRVLELGAGTGLPGVIAATLGAVVTQSDYEEKALDLCRINGRRNNATVNYLVADWTAWPRGNTPATGPFDWIIGADILYGPALHPALRQLFETLLAPGGRVLIADPLRAASITFLESLQADGWLVSGTKYNLGDIAPRPVGVFEIARA